MPIIHRIREKNCQIGIWEINESLNDLVKLSNNLDSLKFKTKKRKIEFLSIRLLLKEIAPNISISYNKYGAPEIESNNSISISHSKKFTAIIISKYKVGIDIEKISKKPLKLSSKFILRNTHKPLCEEKATLIWCCKETIFKWYQKGNINFINDIKINPFTIEEKGRLIVKFRKNDLTLHYRKIDTHFLVYVCK